MTKHISIVLDGKIPGGRFVDVENPQGESIRVGKVIERDDGTVELRITAEDIDKALGGAR